MTVREKARDLTESLVSFRLAAFVAILGACISGTFGAAIGAVGVRDHVLADIHGAIKVAVATEAQDRVDALSHYVTREEWLDWRRAESEKRDRQFFELRELMLRR